jgi:hypothetical protein
MAVDFAKLPKRLEQTPSLSEVATSLEDDRLAKRDTNRPPDGASETWRLPRVVRLPAVAAMPLAENPIAIAKSVSFEPDEWMSAPLLPRRRDPRANRKKLLTAMAVAMAAAALPAGYFVARNPARPVKVTAIPQAPTDKPPVETLRLREARAPTATASNAESRVEPEVQAPSLQQTPPLDPKPTESRIEAKPPPVLPDKGSLAAGREASSCFPSASAVRESVPGAWPSWTLRAPGHEGTRCWYASTRGGAHEHR